MPKKSTVKQGRRGKSPRAKKPQSGIIYQLTITLLESKPVIWRRIQVEDCKLDKLHEHVQTAMGWTNSHLHQFRVGDQYYGDPELMEENFEEFNFRNSLTTSLSEVLPADGKQFSFLYEYDFGDSWDHEIRFEKVVEPAPGESYPRCIDGERACPPEDCVGLCRFRRCHQRQAPRETRRTAGVGRRFVRPRSLRRRRRDQGHASRVASLAVTRPAGGGNGSGPLFRSWNRTAARPRASRRGLASDCRRQRSRVEAAVSRPDYVAGRSFVFRAFARRIE